MYETWDKESYLSVIERVLELLVLFFNRVLSVRDRSIPRDIAGALRTFYFSVELTAALLVPTIRESLCAKPTLWLP